MIRHVIGFWLLFLLVMYIMTEDPEEGNEETPLDQIMNFTALLILTEIDNIVGSQESRWLNEFIGPQASWFLCLNSHRCR